ncbi:MAG: 7TM domain-containing protein [bacterium]
MKKHDISKRIIVNEQGKLLTLGRTLRQDGAWLFLLFVLPAVLIALKVAPWTYSFTMMDMLSLQSLPEFMAVHVQRLMIMSLGALIVVIFRLTLGIRVLGPVRPILIALTYQITGFIVGTVFLVCVMVLIAIIRPILRSAGMPYFARIAMVLSLVCIMVLLALKLAVSFGLEEVLSVGLLPVVVLTFAAEGFAKTLYNEGIRSASWRALMTIAVAAIIKTIVDLLAHSNFILSFPEILFMQIGLIYLIARFFNYRALQFLNPKPVSLKKPHRRTKAKTKAKMKAKTKAKMKAKTKMKKKNSEQIRISTMAKGGF